MTREEMKIKIVTMLAGINIEVSRHNSGDWFLELNLNDLAEKILDIPGIFTPDEK